MSLLDLAAVRSARRLVLAACLALAACGTTPEEQAVTTMQDAIRTAREGDLDRAAEMLEQAHEERPGFVDPLMFLANVHERRGDLDAARDAYTRALEVDPTLTPAGVALALTYVAEDRDEEGRAWLVRALDADPGFEPTVYNLGMLCEDADDPAEAAEWYRVAAVLDITSSRAVVRLAVLHLRAGRREHARALAVHALERRPDDAEAAAILAELDERDGHDDGAASPTDPSSPDGR